MCGARGFFRSQLLHLQIHHFNVIVINFPSSLIRTSKYSHDLELLNIILTMRKIAQGSSDKSSQAEYGRCFSEPYDYIRSGTICFPGGYKVTQWCQSNLRLPKLDIQIMYQLQTLLHDIALAEKTHLTFPVAQADHSFFIGTSPKSSICRWLISYM